jgi:hypothetical protein
VELNARSVGATGRAEIWRNKGGMGVPRAQGDRLCQAECLFPITDAGLRNNFAVAKQCVLNTPNLHLYPYFYST